MESSLNRPSLFRRQDVERAIKAAQASGLPIARIEIDPHTARITVVIGEAADEPKKENPWHGARVSFSKPRKRKTYDE